MLQNYYYYVGCSFLSTITPCDYGETNKAFSFDFAFSVFGEKNQSGETLPNTALFAPPAGELEPIYSQSNRQIMAKMTETL